MCKQWRTQGLCKPLMLLLQGPLACTGCPAAVMPSSPLQRACGRRGTWPLMLPPGLAMSGMLHCTLCASQTASKTAEATKLSLQAISFMLHLAEDKGIWGPFLVVAPASTLHNWDNELHHFCPAFKVRRRRVSSRASI